MSRGLTHTLAVVLGIIAGMLADATQAEPCPVVPECPVCAPVAVPEPAAVVPAAEPVPATEPVTTPAI